MKASTRNPSRRHLTRRQAIATLGLGVPAVLTTWRSAGAQAKLRNITFVQPNPSAINSFPLSRRDRRRLLQGRRPQGPRRGGGRLGAGAAGAGRRTGPDRPAGPGAGAGGARARRRRGVHLQRGCRRAPSASWSRGRRLPDAGRPQGQGDRHRHARRRRGRLRPRHPHRPRHDRRRATTPSSPSATAGRRPPASCAATSRPMSRRPATRRSSTSAALRCATSRRTKFLTYFGNGYAALGDYIAKNPDVIEGFGRALVRGTSFALDDAEPRHGAEAPRRRQPPGGREQGLRPRAVRGGDRQGDAEGPLEGLGLPDPAHWDAWQKSLLASGDLKQPLPNLQAAYTNKFVEAWNRQK